MIWNWQAKQDLLSTLFWLEKLVQGDTLWREMEPASDSGRTVKEEVTNDLKVQYYGHLQVHTLILGSTSKCLQALLFKKCYNFPHTAVPLFTLFVPVSLSPPPFLKSPVGSDWSALTQAWAGSTHSVFASAPPVFRQSWLHWGRGWRRRLDSCDITTLLKSWRLVRRQFLNTHCEHFSEDWHFNISKHSYSTKTGYII